mmetsp:Transcript_19723/g.58478  ORF Transcript_19723/g.58478 Transcript_19723/m.58478 type:complete len:308 (+) Transcript_19723:829-1752(+)
MRPPRQMARLQPGSLPQRRHRVGMRRLSTACRRSSLTGASCGGRRLAKAVRPASRRIRCPWDHHRRRCRDHHSHRSLHRRRCRHPRLQPRRHHRRSRPVRRPLQHRQRLPLCRPARLSHRFPLQHSHHHQCRHRRFLRRWRRRHCQRHHRRHSRHRRRGRRVPRSRQARSRPGRPSRHQGAALTYGSWQVQATWSETTPGSRRLGRTRRGRGPASCSCFRGSRASGSMRSPTCTCCPMASKSTTRSARACALAPSCFQAGPAHRLGSFQSRLEGPHLQKTGSPISCCTTTLWASPSRPWQRHLRARC